MSSLKDKTLVGAFWSFLQLVGSSGIQFFVTVILARLLLPADFGLIAMLSIFIALSQTLVQAGFNQALIQKKDADEDDFSSVFYINFTVSILLYFVLFFCAPFIADFYHQPALTKITRVISLIFVINSLGYVQDTRLKKNLDFKKLAYIHIPSTIIAGTVSVAMAYTGFGVWAIVAQQLIMRSIFVLQLWLYSKWKPLLRFDKQKAKKLFSFGGKLMVSGIINTVTGNLYRITIGKFFPVQTLGYYENADKLTGTPTDTISSVLNSVAFPAFSQVQDDNKKLKAGYKKIMQQVLFWLTPILIIAAILAEPIFRFVFGEKWLPAVPYFQILCIARIFSPLSDYNLNLINVKGRSDIFLKLEIVKKTFLIIGVFTAIPFGVIALVWFRLIYNIVVYFVNSHYSGKFIDYSTWMQIKDILPIFGFSAVMGVGIYFLNFSLQDIPDILRVSIAGLTGIIFFCTLAHFARLDPYCEFKDMIQQKILNRLKK